MVTGVQTCALPICLPSKWNGMSFKLKFMGKTYRVKVDKSGGEVTEIDSVK